MPKKIPKEKTTDYKAAFEDLQEYLISRLDGIRKTWGDRMDDKDYAKLDGEEEATKNAIDYMKYFKEKHTHDID